MAARLSKADYNKLSASGKAKLKKSLAKAPARRSTPRMRHVNNRVTGSSLPRRIMDYGRGIVEKKASDFFRKLTGFGDYKVQSNTLVNGNDPPAFGTMGRGTIVRHREYIQDIKTPGDAFTVTTLPINAGLPSTFPWLSAIAQNYEQYCIRGMVFEYKSMSSDALNSTNTALGNVILATQYNSVAPVFSSKAQMENHEFCTAVRTSASVMHPIECARGETPISCLYTRGGDAPAGSDLRLYDLGKFSIATIGQQAAATIGELWVTYEIELLKPQLDVLTDVCEELTDHYTLASTGSPPTTWVAGGPTLQAGSNLGSFINLGPSEARLFFPADSSLQHYFVAVTWVANPTSVTVNTPVTLTYGSGVSGVAMFNNYADNNITTNSGSVTIVQGMSFAVSVALSSVTTNNYVSMSLPFGGDFSILSGDVFIFPLSSAVVPALVARRGQFESKSEAKSVRRAPVPIDEDEEDYEDEDMKEFIAYQKFRKAQAAMAMPAGSAPTPPALISVAEPLPMLSRNSGSPAPPKTPSRK
jgi:hypothetical protein